MHMNKPNVAKNISDESLNASKGVVVGHIQIRNRVLITNDPNPNPNALIPIIKMNLLLLGAACPLRKAATKSGKIKRRRRLIEIRIKLLLINRSICSINYNFWCKNLCFSIQSFCKTFIS